MKQKTEYLEVKLTVGYVSLIVGFLAANFALFNWTEQTGLHYLLGNYARYLCAYGGFAAMIFGAMQINDFLVLRRSVAFKPAKKPSKADRDHQRIRPRTLAEDPRKSRSKKTELAPNDFFLEEEKERAKKVVA